MDSNDLEYLRELERAMSHFALSSLGKNLQPVNEKRNSLPNADEVSIQTLKNLRVRILKLEEKKRGL